MQQCEDVGIVLCSEEHLFFHFHTRTFPSLYFMFMPRNVPVYPPQLHDVQNHTLHISSIIVQGYHYVSKSRSQPIKQMQPEIILVTL